jgi:ribonuclease P protein subunit RPR2
MVSKGKRVEQEGARKQVERLFELAEKMGAREQKLADRYVELARKLASKNRISLRRYNRKHCRKCSAYFTAKTLRVRTRPTAVIYTCLKCGHITRIRKK